MRREVNVQTDTLRWADRAGCLGWKLKFVAQNGAPDTVIIVPHYLAKTGAATTLWLELKHPKVSVAGKKKGRSEQQKLLHLRLDTAGAHIHTENDSEKAIEWIASFMNKA